MSRSGDPRATFVAIAQRFDLGYVELLAANPGVDPWLVGAGRVILLPSAHLLPDGPREGIVITHVKRGLNACRKTNRDVGP